MATRILSVENGNAPGQFRIDNAMYQKEPMDVFNNPRIQKITLMWASRMAKSTILDNRINQKVDVEGGNILIILPTDTKGKRWSKINLAPMIRDNQQLREKFADQKSRTSDNEIMFKPYAGGVLVIAGANVPGSLSSWSMEEVYFDEVDEYPPSAGKEGDPIELGMQRAENFRIKKFFFGSTPTIKGASRIEESWNESDQRLYFVPCPYCGHKQMLIFSPKSMFANVAKGYLKFLHKGNEVTYVAYECEDCKKDILPQHKQGMIRNGEWRKMKPHVTDHAGFQISRLYSPWIPWRDVAANFLRSEKRPERYMVFVNKALGELYNESLNAEFTEDEMLLRREPYTGIPEGVILMTAGVDVQDDRLEVCIYGWGLNEECWFIERGVIKGSPEEDLTWTQLDQFILTERYHENGMVANYGKVGGILAVCVDTGDGEHSNVVNNYVAHRRKNRFYAIKGASKPQKDFVISTRTKKKRNFLIMVDTFQGKKKIYYRLNIKQGMDEAGRKIATAQMMHFNMSCDKEYFEQLTAEQLKLKKIDGHVHQVWELPSGKRNEVLDCTDYALAGLHAIPAGGSKNLDPFLRSLHHAWQFRVTKFIQAIGGERREEAVVNETPAGADEAPAVPEQKTVLTQGPRKRHIPTIKIKI